jgi:hypothetical protein
LGKIFLSYRHIDSHFAHRLYDSLTQRLDADIFYDRKIDRANFIEVLRNQIQTCDLFILVTTPNTLAVERIFRPKDWIQWEIRTAQNHEKPIVLAMSYDASPPDRQLLPDPIQGLEESHGIRISVDDYESSVMRLAEFCVSSTEEKIRLNSPAPTSQPIEAKPTMQVKGKNVLIIDGLSSHDSTITINQTNESQKRKLKENK